MHRQQQATDSLPRLRRSAWILLEQPRHISRGGRFGDDGSSYTLCFAVLHGKNLKVSEVQAGAMQQIGLRDMETTDEMDIVKFKSWVKENTYFIEVTDGTDRSLRFITKNQ
eukprot:gene14552-11561_t